MDPSRPATDGQDVKAPNCSNGSNVVSRRPTITFHIGPGKTGTTSIQTALAGSLTQFDQQGVFIPSGFGTNGHLSAAFDYLCHSETRSIPINARAFLYGLGSECAGAWPSLLRQCTPDRRWMLVSQEVLSVLNAAGVRHLVSQFPDFEVRAVAMYRPVSRLVPSLYSQEAMLMRVPDFELYARRCLELLMGDVEHEYLWMDTSWLRSTWAAAGVSMDLVDGAPEISATSLQALLGHLLPDEVNLPEVPHCNEGLSAYGVDLWREHLHRTNPHYLIPGFKAYEAMRALDPWTTNEGLGGAYRLTPSVARAADAAFPNATMVDGDTLQARQHLLRRDLSRAQLSSLLKAGDPLTQRIPGSVADDSQRRARTLRQVGRQQRRLSALWSVGAQVRRLQRRPAPIRADWTFTY